MATKVPFMPFLRPLRLPQPSTMRHYLRFSTSTARNQDAQPQAPNKRPKEDRNLLASRKASPTYPPPSMKSLPRPKISKASRRTAHPPKQRSYPTRQPSHHQPVRPKLIPAPVAPLSAELCAPNLAYFVTRTRNNELPVYQDRKRGGNLLQTYVRKIDGEPAVLRDELRTLLRLQEKDCVVNPVTRQVVMKGHFKGVVDRFLRERLF